MIPLAQLITPISPVTPAGGQMGAALGDAGEMMALQKERDRQFGQKQLEDYQKWLDEAAQRGIQREHAEGVNRYYDAQTALHKDQLSEKQDAAALKRAQEFRDAFRKAKTPIERSQIIQAAAAAGLNLNESDTALPGSPGTESAPSASAAPTQVDLPPVSKETADVLKGPPTGEAGKTAFAEYMTGAAPKAGSGKMAPFDLGAYMASPAAAATSSGGPEPASAGGSPFPWDLAGFPEPKAPQAAPATPKPSRGGKFTVTDKSGNKVLEWDEPLEKKHMSDLILEHAQPLIKDARTPENAAAARRAADLTANMADPSWTSKDAMDAFLKAYTDETSQMKKAPVGGGGGGAPGVPGKQELHRLDVIEQREDALISKHLGAEKAGDLTKMEHALDELEARLKAGGGHNQVLAQVADVKAANGRAAAQQEFKAIQGATGAAANLETLMNHYLTPDGRISEETVRQMLAGVQQLRAAAKADRERIAAAIEEDFNNSMIPQMMKPEEIEKGKRRVRGAASGNYGESKPPEGQPAPSGGASGKARAEKWLREHGGG